MSKRLACWSAVTVLGLASVTRVDAGVTLDELVYGASSNAPEMVGDVAGWAVFTHAGEADLKDPSNPASQSSVSVNELATCVPFTVFENPEWQLYAGPQFDWFRYEFSDIDGLDDLDVYSAAAQLAAVYEGMQDWEWMLCMAPGFYSDFKKSMAMTSRVLPI